MLYLFPKPSAAAVLFVNFCIDIELKFQEKRPVHENQEKSQENQ